MDKSSLDWTHQQALKEVSDLCADSTSAECPDCLMVIALWNQGGKYHTQFWNVGMSVSQMIALLEIEKQRLLKYMEDHEHEHT
jgi:hypothetical protein